MIAFMGGKVRGLCEDMRYLRSSGQYLKPLSRTLQRVICRREKCLTFWIPSVTLGIRKLEQGGGADRKSIKLSTQFTRVKHGLFRVFEPNNQEKGLVRGYSTSASQERTTNSGQERVPTHRWTIRSNGAATCADVRSIDRSSNAGYRSILVLTSLVNTCAGQSERHVPPAPFRTPDC